MVCVICLEEFSDTKQDFSLPECDHKFHTECIVHWFRTGHDKCPCCLRPGQCIEENNQNRRFGYAKVDYIFPEVSQRARSKNAPPEMKKIYEKYNKENKKLINLNKEEKEKKTETGVYKNIKKQLGEITRKKWKLQRNIYKIKITLCELFPIYPIIIVTRKTTTLETKSPNIQL